MFQPNGSTIECGTCVASNTSACSECIVSFVLANDAGPIEYVPTPVEIQSASAGSGSTDAAIELFVRSGLVDDPVVFLSAAEFTDGVVRERVAG